MEASAAISSNFLSPVGFVLPTLACLFSSLREGPNRTYDGYKVFRVNTTNEVGFETLRRLMLGDNFDFWSRPSMNFPTDIMVCPEQVTNTKIMLRVLGLRYDIMIENVKNVIQEEKASMLLRQSSEMSWDTYHRLSTIHAWMESLAAQYPSLVSILTIGKSSEGRPLKVMRISNAGENSQKPAIWIDGGIHAREWISPAVVTYMANELIQQAVQDPKYTLVDVYDWYISPNLNPDGYEFTHSGDRMWRKTRSNNEGFFASLFKCKGTDPNRNWAYQWGGKGTSKNPCSEIYHGTKAASEPEVSHVQDFIYARREQIKLFLTFHSYSQMLFLPWGYDKIRVDDHDELMVVANKAAAALQSVYGTKFDVGPSPELLYAAAGGSEDYAKGIAKIKYSYCFELRDTGKHGFLLPSDQIIPSGIETFAAVKSMATDLIQIYNLGKQPEPAVPENPPPPAPETGNEPPPAPAPAPENPPPENQPAAPVPETKPAVAVPETKPAEDA